MTRDEFKVLVKGMKAIYTDPKFIPDKDAFDVWYELVKDLDYTTTNIAIQKYILTNKFPPTIADIREQYSGITNGEQTDSMAAWGILYKAICNSSNHATEEFSKLPILIQKTVGSPNQLRVWALDEHFNENVVQSNFIRNYEKVVKNNRQFQQMPERIQNIIKHTIEKQESAIALENTNEEIKNKTEYSTPMPERFKEKSKIYNRRHSNGKN